MLNRFRDYVQDNPLGGWLLEIAFLSAFVSTLYLALGAAFYGFRHEPFKPGMLLLFASFVLTLPTLRLVQRFSDEQRREKPVPPRQERGIGLVSVALVLCSISVLSVLVLGKWVGLKWVGLVVSSNEAAPLLLLFSSSALLGLALGYAVRHTRLGRSALLLCVGWLSLLTVVAFALLARGMVAR